MSLSNKALNEFQQIWLEEHPNHPLTRKQLIEMANKTIQAIELIYGKNTDPKTVTRGYHTESSE